MIGYPNNSIGFPMINFYAAAGMDPRTGYGRMEQGIWEGLNSRLIHTIPSGFMSTKIRDEWIDLSAKRGVHLKANAEVTLATGNPIVYGHDPLFETTKRWLFTMSESDLVSKKWVEIINAHWEKVFVTCPSLVQIYQDSGVKIPVYFAPLGVDDRALPPLKPDRHYDPDGDEQFVFMTYTLGDLRKGAEIAYEAFKIAFGRQGPRFKLRIKTRRLTQWVASLADEQIEIVEGSLTDDELWSLYDQAHCFLFPTRAEGFGYPPREATMMGIPTIGTQWLGLWDIDRWGIPLHYTGFNKTFFDENEANDADSKWAIPDRAHLVDQMKWVVAHYPEALTIARKGRHYLYKNFSWKQAVEPIANELYKELEVIYGRHTS